MKKYILILIISILGVTQSFAAYYGGGGFRSSSSFSSFRSTPSYSSKSYYSSSASYRAPYVAPRPPIQSTVNSGAVFKTVPTASKSYFTTYSTTHYSIPSRYYASPPSSTIYYRPVYSYEPSFSSMMMNYWMYSTIFNLINHPAYQVMPQTYSLAQTNDWSDGKTDFGSGSGGSLDTPSHENSYDRWSFGIACILVLGVVVIIGVIIAVCVM